MAGHQHATRRRSCATIARRLLGAALAWALLSALPCSRASAAGWTQPEDAYYLKLWGRMLKGSRAFGHDGELVDTQPFTDLQLNVYGEYGVTDAWTALFYGTPTGYVTSIADTWFVGPLGLGVRRALLRADLRLAVEARYALEPGIGDLDVFAQPGQASAEIVYVPVVDNHRGELELQLGHGLSFGWLSAALGMRFNAADGIDHAVIGGAQLGFRSGSFQFELHVQTYQPLGDVTRTNASGAGQTRYVGLGIGIGYRFGDGFSVIVGADGGPARSNAAAAPLLAGIELQ